MLLASLLILVFFAMQSENDIRHVSWKRIQKPYSAPLTINVATPMAINHILADGISHNLLKLYCRFCMMIRMRRLKWPQKRF